MGRGPAMRASSPIPTIVFDPQGQLWIATDGGRQIPASPTASGRAASPGQTGDDAAFLCLADRGGGDRAVLLRRTARRCSSRSSIRAIRRIPRSTIRRRAGPRPWTVRCRRVPASSPSRAGAAGRSAASARRSSGSGAGRWELGSKPLTQLCTSAVDQDIDRDHRRLLQRDLLGGRRRVRRA